VCAIRTLSDLFDRLLKREVRVSRESVPCVMDRHFNLLFPAAGLVRLLEVDPTRPAPS